ncbi:FkbM family methyltransferase [Alphaproteobacteria bacterium]|nr:FkbM family methyltransferase [Alphaproteobacteria bacterium]
MDFFYTSGLFLKLRKIGRHLGINKFIRNIVDINGYQYDFDHMMINSLRKGDIFWDVGSNHGELVKKAKYSLGKDIYCIAFEPHPILSKNLKKLNFKNYQVVNVALSNKVGDAEFTFGSDLLQTTGRIIYDRKNSKTTKVNVIDIDYALNVLNLKNPNVIKIDVEGHEYEVLSSILSNINKLNKLRAIYVEIHMTILDKRKLSFEMNKLITKFKLETKFKQNWLDLSHFILER